MPNGKIGLIPKGPGYDDPREDGKPIAEFDPDSAVEVAHLLLNTAAIVRAGKTKE